MAGFSLPQTFGRDWWLWLLRGIFAVLFGILAFAWPAAALVSLVLLFGIYALLDGIANIFLGARSRHWSLLLFGVLGVIAGIVTLVYPGISAVALLIVIAVWAVVRGVLEIVAAIALRKVIANERLLILAGVLSVAFGGLVMAFPGAGALAIVWAIALYAIVIGVLSIALAFRLRTWGRRVLPVQRAA